MTHPTDALRLVPLEPTAEIIRAMCVAVENGEFMDPSDPAWVDGYDAWIPSVKAAWKDALAAAPASPLPEGGGDMDWQSVAMWMGFSASVIKSGEPWTDQCQQHYDEAKAAFARLAAPTGAK